LGGSNGIGFGWNSIDVFKLGVEYKMNNAWTLRAGYNHGENPIESRDVTFNILAPGVVEDHVTLGFTYAVSPNSELSMAYMHAFEEDVTGPTNPTYFPVGGNDTIQMHQDSLGIAYSMKF
jgi:long-chain fatty acid transport protein